jgi:outer membrane translocation and assembly module TamA
LGKKHTISIGNEFQSFKVENTEGRFVSVDYSKLDSSEFGRKQYDRIEAGCQFNTLDNAVFPRKGVKLQVNAAYVQNIKESDKNFVQVSSEASFYNSLGRFTLATRTGVAANLSDDYEFFQANSLGGLTNLRGYRRDRFAGKTSVYQNTELRFTISNFNAYITKGVWGVLAFYDNGRVWMPEETSDTWHHGYGGGLWFLPFNKMSMTATYGVSKEEKLVSVTAGFLF